MQVSFESRDPQAVQLRELALRRVQFSMRRLTWMVPRAKVQLSDVNGPRGGVDKRCQVELKTDGNGTVLVTSVARDWPTALDSALTRAAGVLRRSWRKSKSRVRTTQRTPGFGRLADTA